MLRRHFASSSFKNLSQKYKIVIVGGGSGGISVASQLARHPEFKNRQDILIIDPSSFHYYQPLWTFVGAGIKTLNESKMEMKNLIPSEAFWLQQRVSTIQPSRNKLIVEDGSEIDYDYLVVAPGIQINWDKIPGLMEALESEDSPVASNYSDSFVEKTFELLKRFKGGNAVFTQPATPIKCAGAPQKIVYLAEEIFRENKIRDRVNVSFHSGMGKIFAVDKYAADLTKICQNRDINVNLLSDLIEIDAKNRKAIFKQLGPQNEQTPHKVVDYDLLHVTPPMGPPTWLNTTQLTNAAGWVDVNTKTLQHNKFDNVFAIGDASSLPTSKTAAAAAAQSGVLTQNLLSLIRHQKELTASYGGYTSCPLITGKEKLILAEFDYQLAPLETFPFDQSKERASMYYLVSDILPSLYWNGMMKGLWQGPSAVRKVLHLGK